jgi:RNA polymerase sigma factor (sigma-70 family)
VEEYRDQAVIDYEKQSIRRVLDGHKEEYAFLVNLYKNKIYGLLRGMGVNEQDAQDLTQETLVKAYRKLDLHDPNKSFGAWLYTIATNLLKDFWRRTRQPDWLEELFPDPSLGDNPEEALLQAENQSELQVLMSQLPPNYRMVLLLRYTNDLSYQEMSELLNVPLNKIQNDLYRAKKKLKQMMTAEEVKNDVMLKPR